MLSPLSSYNKQQKLFNISSLGEKAALRTNLGQTEMKALLIFVQVHLSAALELLKLILQSSLTAIFATVGFTNCLRAQTQLQGYQK